MVAAISAMHCVCSMLPCNALPERCVSHSHDLTCSVRRQTPPWRCRLHALSDRVAWGEWEGVTLVRKYSRNQPTLVCTHQCQLPKAASNLVPTLAALDGHQLPRHLAATMSTRGGAHVGVYLPVYLHAEQEI